MDVPVILNIMWDSAPPPVEGIEIRVEGGNVIIDWLNYGATGYHIYSSYDPYGTYTLLTTVYTNQYIEPLEEGKFYYVTSFY